MIRNRENARGMVEGFARVAWGWRLLGHDVELGQGIQRPPVCIS